MKNHCARWLVVGLTLTLCSCSGGDSNRKETYPVTGEVYVDGQPANEVAVTLHNVAGIDTENPTFSMSFTDAEGKFAISTYEESDGVPEGEYKVTFMWGELNKFSMQYGGPDKLKNRYNDPEQSEFSVKVVKGEPTDMGRIDLTTN